MSGRLPAVSLLLAAGGLGLWLLLAGVEPVSGLDVGGIGFAILVLSAWSALHGVWRLSLTETELRVSPAEWHAWIGAGFMALAVAYFVARMHVYQVSDLALDAEAKAVARNLVLLLVAWHVLAHSFARRWKDRVQEDERDREIEREAAAWSRHVIGALVLVLAILLGISPPDRLQWATLPMIANLLVLVLMVGTLVENAGSAIRHWLDRR